MAAPSSNATAIAREFYDSANVDAFYYNAWGGQNIHFGIYNSPTDTIATASERTVERMASTISTLTSSTRVLDLGAGYGGSARWLASKHGCKVTCLNLSRLQNQRNSQLCAEGGLSDMVDVVEGNFEDLPFEDGCYDVVWSQDAFMHSGDRAKIVEEISRVLKPHGGEVVFTDVLAAEGADEAALASTKARLSISEFGTRKYYAQE